MFSYFYQVIWKFRLHYEPLPQWYLSVDGTDCPIQEPSPFSISWYSHKTNSAALRYEVAVTVRRTRVVWAREPFPAESHSDSKIFSTGLRARLGSFEIALTDAGYGGTRCINSPSSQHYMARSYSVIRAQHETLNGRLKNLNVLVSIFCHNLSSHGACCWQ